MTATQSTTPRRPLVIGNWKMNGSRAQLAEARAIDRAAARYPAVDVALAPPFPLIASMREAVAAIAVGGQDCHSAPAGAYTGNVAAPLLADLGAGFVIVGHSERRRDHAESDAVVQAKAIAALQSGLAVVLCVGETLAERDAGRAEATVAGQLQASLPPVEVLLAHGGPARLSIGYEPVWAIGTGRVAAVEDVVAMHATIRGELDRAYGAAAAAVRVIYGGSVNADNAASLLSAPGVDGALVGGASLTAEAFVPIIAAAPQV